MDLNEIIENLCDWMRENKITVRRMGFYPKFDRVCLELSLGKETNGGSLAIGCVFYVGEDVSSVSWNKDWNDLRLREMIEELKRRGTDE